MNINLNFLKSKKARQEERIESGDVVFNDDNVIKMNKFKEKEPSVIEISTAVRIMNFSVMIISLALLAALVYGLWWVLGEVGFIDDISNGLNMNETLSGEDATTEASIEENSASNTNDENVSADETFATES